MAALWAAAPAATAFAEPVSADVNVEVARALYEQASKLVEKKKYAEARDLLGTSRKYAIALLEHLDELRITRRNGDLRELVRRAAP